MSDIDEALHFSLQLSILKLMGSQDTHFMRKDLLIAGPVHGQTSESLEGNTVLDAKSFLISLWK